MMAAEEEVVVCTRLSEIIGVNWDGTLDFNFQWNLQQSNSLSSAIIDPHSTSQSSSFYVTDIKYSAMIGGFSLVFASGKAAFLPLNDAEYETNPQYNSAGQQKYCLSKLQFIIDVDNALVTSVNHKYQLLAFGLRNAEVILCCINELNWNVIVTHRLRLSASAFPNAAAIVGGISCLQWSPDSTVLAGCWEKGGFAIWSVFGALLSCSLTWDYGGCSGQQRIQQSLYNSMSWASEGYQLWMLEKKSEENDKQTERTTSKVQLSQINLAKSVLASNPSCISTCSEHVLLIAEDKLYLGIGATPGAAKARQGVDDTDVEPTTPTPTSEHLEQQLDSEPYDVGNHQWVIIPLPAPYTTQNAPIRFCAMDELGQHVAIAGRFGFAHYSLVTRRWKLFGNETQERDFEVCGGLLWWNGNVVLSCYNIVEGRFELRAYPQRSKLDNQHAKVVTVSCEILLLAVHRNRLLTLMADGTFHMYAFLDTPPSSSSSLRTHVKRNSETSLSSFASGSSMTSGPPSLPVFVPVPTYSSTGSFNHNTNGLQLVFLHRIVLNVHFSPECVTSILLSSIHLEGNNRNSTDADSGEQLENDSILMNVCGRLILLEHDGVDQGDQQTLLYKFVTILASGVENVWLNQHPSEHVKRPHLTNALWLACGSNGMNVWLPLLPTGNQNASNQSRAFISRRIMLPINTHIYPLGKF